MDCLVERKKKSELRRETALWQRAAAGLFALSLVSNTFQATWINKLDAERKEALAQIHQAEKMRDMAVRELGELSIAAIEERKAREEQAADYEAISAWEYIGECTVTAYCPCTKCCGKWADGLTATGLPAVPGIVAVDPEVIPIGSTVVIDGQKYLAADTGVTGNHVDIFMKDHNDTVQYGVKTEKVWVIK